MKKNNKYASAELYYQKHKDRILKKNAVWRVKNHDRVMATRKKYLTSERGFFMEMWNSIRRSGKHNSFKDFDDFFDHWEDQKRAWGWTCPATGVTMTTVKASKSGKRCPTNVSRDRVLPNMGYNRKNLIFTSWAYNHNKCSLSPEEAMSFLRIIRDRYGVDYLLNVIEGDRKLYKDNCKEEYDWNDGR